MRTLSLVLLASLAVLLAACTGTATPTATPAATPTAAPADSGPGAGLPDVASVVERVLPGVVQVLATVEQRDFFGRLTDSTSQGSGVLFDAEGHILTNNHVVEDAKTVEVVLHSGETIPVEVVGTDPRTDLAVLKADPADVDGLPVVPLGDTDAMRIGDWVIAIGSPLGYEGSVTVGIVSSKGRSLSLDSSTTLYDLVQTDAVINPGNSGGPLLNLRGEVIGINTAIIRGQLASGQQADGIGFAISTGTARPVSAQLITNGRVIRPQLGVFIADLTPALAAERGIAASRGILVTDVIAGGPAERAGIQDDDVIVAIDATPVASTSELIRLFLTDYHVGDEVTVTLLRASVQQTVTLELEEVTGG